MFCVRLENLKTYHYWNYLYWEYLLEAYSLQRIIIVSYLKPYKSLATVVKGNPKASFSIATTQMCRVGRYSFPWIAPLYPWYVLYIAEC